jgi:hypothetical protein
MRHIIFLQSMDVTRIMRLIILLLYYFRTKFLLIQKWSVKERIKKRLYYEVDGQRKPEMYSRIKRKTRRNLGLEYKSDSSRKTVKVREQGPSCLCKNHCRDKLSCTLLGVRKEGLRQFWNMPIGRYFAQNTISVLKSPSRTPAKHVIN